MKKPLRKSNFLTSSLKTPVVLAESLGFFVTVSLMFLFLHVFISSDVFGCFHCWLYLSISLFLHCCCYCECYGFERAFFTLRSFFLTLLPAFIKASLELEVQPWRLQVLPLRFEKQTRPTCLFESHSIQQKVLVGRFHLCIKALRNTI